MRQSKFTVAILNICFLWFDNVISLPFSFKAKKNKEINWNGTWSCHRIELGPFRVKRPLRTVDVFVCVNQIMVKTTTTEGPVFKFLTFLFTICDENFLKSFIKCPVEYNIYKFVVFSFVRLWLSFGELLIILFVLFFLCILLYLFVFGLFFILKRKKTWNISFIFRNSRLCEEGNDNNNNRNIVVRGIRDRSYE